MNVDQALSLSIRNCLDGLIQKAVVKGFKIRQRPLTTSDPHLGDDTGTWYYLTFLLMLWILESSASSASLRMTPSCVVKSAYWKDRIWAWEMRPAPGLRQFQTWIQARWRMDWGCDMATFQINFSLSLNVFLKDINLRKI